MLGSEPRAHNDVRYIHIHSSSLVFLLGSISISNLNTLIVDLLVPLVPFSEEQAFYQT